MRCSIFLLQTTTKWDYTKQTMWLRCAPANKCKCILNYSVWNLTKTSIILSSTEQWRIENNQRERLRASWRRMDGTESHYNIVNHYIFSIYAGLFVWTSKSHQLLALPYFGTKPMYMNNRSICFGISDFGHLFCAKFARRYICTKVKMEMNGKKNDRHQLPLQLHATMEAARHLKKN